MDDNQNTEVPADPTQGGNVPTSDQPVTPATDTPVTPAPTEQVAPAPEEKCSTCGNQTTGCTCPPSVPTV